jgi:hypothetical protein
MSTEDLNEEDINMKKKYIEYCHSVLKKKIYIHMFVDTKKQILNIGKMIESMDPFHARILLEKTNPNKVYYGQNGIVRDFESKHYDFFLQEILKFVNEFKEQREEDYGSLATYLYGKFDEVGMDNTHIRIYSMTILHVMGDVLPDTIKGVLLNILSRLG